MKTINIIRRVGVKHIIIAALLAISVYMPQEASATDVFESLCGDAHVECTYISGRFARSKNVWRSQTGSHAMNLGSDFSRMYVYECYSEESAKKAKDILNKYLKSEKEMELVMKQDQGIQQYRVYEYTKEDKKLYKLIIWSSDAPNLVEVVVVDWDNGLE